jgi:hypothetical protein
VALALAMALPEADALTHGAADADGLAALPDGAVLADGLPEGSG